MLEVLEDVGEIETGDINKDEPVPDEPPLLDDDGEMLGDVVEPAAANEAQVSKYISWKHCIFKPFKPNIFEKLSLVCYIRKDAIRK